MIEGLKVTVAGTELRDLCAKRADYHRTRAAAYSKKIAAFGKGDDGDDESESQLHALMSSTTANPAKQLTERHRQHIAAAEELEFTAAHIDASERYLLERDDLMRIGVIAAHGFGF
jgi:hypothetical protein